MATERGWIVPVVAAVVLAALSLVLTMSRSGMTAFVASIVMTLWLVGRVFESRRRQIGAGICLTAVVVVVFGWAGPDVIASRFSSAGWGDFNSRRGAWLDALGVVRDFMIENALYWMREFHIDGFRLDAVHAIVDDSETHVLQELAERARGAAGGRHVHLVVENDANEAHLLARAEDGRPRCYDAQWADDLHHCLHVAVTGESAGYYASYAGRLDLLGRALVGEEVVWDGTSTYLANGAEVPGQADDQPRPEFAPVTPSALWRLPAGLGRQYRAVSGDPNPIHTSRVAAKALGFARPIAHGMWTHARVLAALENRLPEVYEVAVEFTKPILLPGTVGFAATRTAEGWRAAVTNRDGTKPYLLATI